MKNIDHIIYTHYFYRAINYNPQVNLNCDVPEYHPNTQYFKSEQGISYLKTDGFIGGIARFKQGNERLAEMHQQHRINKGGYFLECYDGKLTKLYEKQGFTVVGRIKFNPEFAKEGWDKDEDLRKQPDIVFMSLYPIVPIEANYETVYSYARFSKNLYTEQG